uniref:Uncharacterized protein n=1 Tax=viral metagenome TaxID=1070528 RepID=A0A6H1ZQT6_9ZZZZ
MVDKQILYVPFMTTVKKTAEYCYAAWDDGNNKWVKGCNFDKADDFLKAYALHLITGKPVEEFLEKRRGK